ncbi:efflux RND transporter permease subunit [Paludibaculum fermentans]|uniref:Efflux RND transporter permease subunit n=1 Tax=Paludibaculum fermentans TaxID=1473598 RepID=A0A7S7NJZ9_PALFE|nr:efflux RND transporter permease subunit [Paludibaculum fermentans]QOY85031.1 efflux RND transporter permease subunit [Paludibaculum fermentans]
MTKALASFVEAHGRAMLLIVLSFAVAGVFFAFQLPIAIFPQTDFPRIVILVDNGISPVDVQMLTVTRPIEEAVRIVPGISTIRSTTARGSTEISVFFRWDVDILNALHLVQGRIAQITPSLPPGCRFYINRLTFSVFPMLGYSITSPSRSQSELWDLAYYNLAPRLYNLPGVAETRIVGGRPPEYHILVDPQKLNSYNMPLTKVTEAIRSSNIITAAGMLQENYHLYLTTVTGLLRSKEQIEDTVVDMVRGTPVTVKNIAEVVLSERPVYNIVTADGRPAVLINVLQQPDGNAVEIADAVKREFASIRKTLPPDIQVNTFYDQSLLVRDSISGVVESILIGLALSVAVLVGFLKSWRTTLVASIVIPIAVLIAIVCMRLFHMSFNLMTLGGLAACIGVVIDDAIVMVENIIVHLSMGLTPAAAARSAIEELTPALIGSTLTPIMVFLPLVFLGGITAVFFRALAMTMVTALLASLFIAIFFTPVLATWLLKKREGEAVADQEQAEQAGEGRWLRWLTVRYEASLHWALEHGVMVMLGAVVIFAGTVGLYYQLGSGFLPEMDEGAFVLDYITPPGTSLQESDRMLLHIEKFLRETPEVESYSRRTGARLALAIAEPNTGDFLIRLKKDRKRSLEEVTSELRRKITKAEPVIEVEFPHILEDLVGDLAWSPQPIEIKIHHDDDKVYKDIAKRVEEWLPKVKGVVDIVNRTVPIGPAVNFRVDLEKAQRAGFKVQDVADLEEAILDGALASNMIRGDRLIGIRVRYPLKDRSSTEKLEALLLTSPTGQTVPLSSIAHIETEEATYEILRENLRNLSAVTARLEGRDLGSAMDEIQRRLPKEIALPAGTDIEYGGLYKIQQESFLGLTQVLMASILLIFIILVFEFRSFSHPIAILAATILCGFGAMLALFMTKTTLNISSFMGAIMVVGIVHKNGILMLDAEQEFTARGFALKDAIFHAGRRRLRPILMTALATIFGMLPLALGVGLGAQMLQPLAIAVIGGVTVSMVLSLLVTPVLFYQLRGRGL